MKLPKRDMLVLFLLVVPSALAYETDPYTNRHKPIKDAGPVLNRKVNQAISEVVAQWRGGQDEWRFVMGIYWRLGGVHWVDKLERWAMKSDEVERLTPTRRQSIYRGIPLCATRVAGVFGVGHTSKINGHFVGSDKIGHFFSQGRKFYKRYRRNGGSEVRAARRSAATERGFFGQKTTGSYSNADLVANYEGFLFYRSLFHDDAVPGKGSILRWRDGKPVIRRPFDWGDHVNDYWDEALNPNHFDRLLYKHMKKKLLALCQYYRKYPHLFVLKDEARLREKYKHLRLRDTSALRLDRLCQNQGQG